VLADEALQYALHHDEPAEFEIRVVRPGGEMRVLHAQAYAVRDEYGEAVRVLGTLQDVTERWQAQEALRESEQRCRTIYEEAPLGIYLMDLNEHFVRANHAFCAMLGYREEELRGQHIATFNHPDDVPIEVSRLERLLAGELPRYYVQKRYIARDSSVVWANLTANAIHDANGVVLYGISIIEEITAQKRAEIQIEAERRRVAYELHDGLAQIAVSVHQHLQTFATDHPPTSEAARHMLSTILDLAQYTVQEARRLIAGIRPTLLDDFGLGTALRSQVNTLRDEDWTVEYQEALGAVRLPAAVETALFWVAQEALTNIRKHAGVRAAQIMLRREGDSVYLEIRDPGRGFDPATPVPPVKLGEHVGLLGIRERIALLDGTCRIESRPGEGTRIAVTVPFHAVRGNTDG
jgi:PAS domain S-box-containing protein